MQLLNRELYHIFIKRKGCFLLLVFLAAEICMAFYGAVNCRDIVYEAEDNKQVYLEYMEQLEGKNTEDKETFVQEHFQKAAEASDKLNRITEAYITGQTDNEEYYQTVLETKITKRWIYSMIS